MKIAENLEKYRFLWGPPLAGLITGILVSWAVFSTLGWCAYDTDNAKIVETNFTWWLFGLQVISTIIFVVAVFWFLKVGDEESHKVGDPGLFFTGCIFVLAAPIISWIMCGIALFIFGLLWYLLLGNNMEGFIETMRPVIIDPKATFLVFGIIVATYGGLGLIWAIIRLPFTSNK